MSPVASSPLHRALARIDGRPYPAYRDLEGRWDIGDLSLVVDHVQGDPFAAPSRLTLHVPSGLGDLARDPDTRLAVEDALLRRFAARLGGSRRGSGRSGLLSIYAPGPEIIERSTLRLRADGTIVVRFRAGLPAQGRRVLGRQAAAMLTEDLPGAATAVQIPPDALRPAIASLREQRHLRRQLASAGLVAFLADDSRLPRRSGVSQEPLPDAIELHAPEALAVVLQGLDGPIRGLGIPAGVTLIVGGGYHGKSTLLQAIQRGHLDHVAGDGRERVVSLPDIVKIRAEDGRAVRGVNISAFLSGLPGGRPTDPFDTDDASGSTSQAAALCEALESGASALLIDEDTSATNLLVRDERMRALVPAAQEPITPLIDRISQLRARGPSVVMVVGGVGDYLAVADRVIGMRAFQPVDLTAAARALAGPPPEPPSPWPASSARILQGGLGGDRVRARDARAVDVGDETIDLSAVEQVLDAAHAATLGQAVRFVGAHLGKRPLPAVLDALDAILDDEGVEALSPYDAPPGDLIRPRRHEVAAAINRLRSLVT